MGKNVVEVVFLGKDKATGVARGVGSTFKTLGKGLLTFGAIGVAATGAVVGAMGGLAISAAPVKNIRDAFDSIADRAGISSEAMVESLQEASAGMVSQTDLMETFNNASQLVGDQFAIELPGAMESLRVVAAATGQDMGYMMNSLVTGIGRLSPMILDNLGIQVDLTQAYDDWAKANGRTVESMTKSEQQTALFTQVQEKLAQNTAGLPDVIGTATQSVGQFKAGIKDAKDSLGLMLLTALKPVMDAVGTFAAEKLPGLIAGLQPVIETIGEFVAVLMEDGLKAALEAVLPPEVLTKFDEFMNKIQPIIDFISANATPILAAMGAMILAVVVPAFIAWAAGAISAAIATITALAPVLLPILAIGAAVGLLVAAWKNDWGGLQTFTQKAIDRVKKIFDGLKRTFDTVKQAVMTVIEWVRNFIDTLGSISLPDWLTPGSATPFELGLLGIADAMETVSGATPSVVGGIGVAGSVGGMGGMTPVYVTIQYRPFISTADRAEAERILTPIINSAVRQATERRQ